MVKYLNNVNSGFKQWRAATDAVPRKKSWLSSFLWWFAIFVACWWLIGIWMRPAKQEVVTAADNAPVVDLSKVPVSAVTSEKINFDIQGLRVSNIALNDFSADANDNDARVILMPTDKGAFIEAGFVSQNTIVPAADAVWRSTDGEMLWRNNAGVEFRRNVTTDGYVITITDTVRNASNAPVAVAPYARLVRPADKASSAGVYTGAIAFANSDIEHEDWRDLDKKSYAYTTTNGFVGFADQYWETVASIDSPDQTMRARKSADNYEADTAAAAVSVAPGASSTITTRIFAGPRDQSVLNAAAALIAGINKTVDYGWFWFLARPMLMLSLIHI